MINPFCPPPPDPPIGRPGGLQWRSCLYKGNTVSWQSFLKERHIVTVFLMQNKDHQLMLFLTYKKESQLTLVLLHKKDPQWRPPGRLIGGVCGSVWHPRENAELNMMWHLVTPCETGSVEVLGRDIKTKHGDFLHVHGATLLKIVHYRSRTATVARYAILWFGCKWKACMHTYEAHMFTYRDGWPVESYPPNYLWHLSKMPITHIHVFADFYLMASCARMTPEQTSKAQLHFWQWGLSAI